MNDLSSQTGAWMAVALTPAAAIFVVAMLLGFAVAYPEAPETQRRGTVVAIESANAAFSTTSLAAPSGQVTVVLTNHDLFWHTYHRRVGCRPGSTPGRDPGGDLHRPTGNLPVLLSGTGPRRGRHARHPDHPLSLAADDRRSARSVSMVRPACGPLSWGIEGTWQRGAVTGN